MRTKAIFAGFAVALAVPLLASASTLSDLQAQITSLLAQIQAIQAQGNGNVSTSVNVSGTASVNPNAIPCPLFSRSLSIGSRGDDVVQLQNYLATQGYFSGSATGYFGALTRAAVGRWQASAGVTASNGIGYGIFGPMSRSYFARFCGQGGSQNQQPFSATPTSGTAPLTVTFTTSDSIVSSSTYSVDFGDNSGSASMTKGSCVGIAAIQGGQGGIRCSFTVSHTYAANGTYTARLLKQTPFSCPNGLMCAQGETAMMMPAPQVVGTVTVTVGASTNSQPFTATPTSGTAPLSVSFSTNDSITASSTYSVNFGDGSSSAMAASHCIAITAIVGGQGGIRCDYTTDHVYASNGTYTAQLLKNTCPQGAQCFVGPLPVASVVITVGSSTASSLSFNASPSVGGVPLTVQFTATAPQGTTLGNTVNFGDGQSGKLLMVPVCSSCNAMGTVSHTYTSVGTYTAQLTNDLCSCPANGICNCPNIPILATATVTVGATSTTPHITKLSAPGSATLGVNDIAEVRNENYYFTLTGLTASSATIQVTTVGCWNSFPSDTPPAIRCMIAVFPIPPITLSVGQTATNYPITLTQMSGTSATFQVNAPATSY